MRTEQQRASSRAYYQRNKAKMKAWHKAYVQRPEVKARRREQMRWQQIERRYSITRDEYLGQIEAQLGRCALCDEPMGDDVCIDHDHTTERFRGLTHRNCNTGLGMFNDDPAKLRQAADYLEAGGFG